MKVRSTSVVEKVGLDLDEDWRGVTIRSICLAWLGCPCDESIDSLALQAISAIELRDSYRCCFYAATAKLHEQHVQDETRRQRIRQLCQELTCPQWSYQFL